MMHNTVLLNGGTVTDKVSASTTLVQADPTKASSKTQKAEKVARSSCPSRTSGCWWHSRSP